MKPLLQKLRFLILYSLYVLLFIAVVDYVFFYRPHMKKLRNPSFGFMAGVEDPRSVPLQKAKYVEPEVMKRLGKANGKKQSSFFNFPKGKADGMVRLCTFGDSYAEGDEVDEVHDYPRLLQNLFVEHGMGNVEVVNFGISGYGFHQSYMLWDAVARDFGCDAHLFGPRGFHPLRDTTFGAIYHWSPYYLHGRYVLENGDAKLIEILGDTYGERFDYHFAFFPRWRYLRYTRNPPMFLKALIPKGRDLTNPFYYDRRDMYEEGRELQSVLLARMAPEASTIFVGHHRQDVVETAVGVGAPNLGAAHFPEMLHFPYIAPKSHAGTWGNQLLARFHFAQLTGRTEGQVTVLDTTDLDWNEHGAAAGRRRSMESYSKVDIQVGGVPAGHFVVPSEWAQVPPMKADALLAINGEAESVLDCTFFPLDFELQPYMEAVLRVEGSGPAKDYSLGKVAVLGGGLNFGLVQARGFEFKTFKEFERLLDRGEPSPLTHGKRRTRGLFFTGTPEIPLAELTGRGSEITVLIDGKPALRGEVGDMGETPGIWFRHHTGKAFRYARANESGLLDIDALPGDSGVVEIVARHWEDGEVRTPIAAWHKRLMDMPPAAKPPDRRIVLSEAGVAVMEPPS